MKTDFLWMFCCTQGIWSETAGPAEQRMTALTFRDFAVYGHSGRLFLFVVTLINSLLRILTAQTGHLDTDFNHCFQTHMLCPNQSPYDKSRVCPR